MEDINIWEKLYSLLSEAKEYTDIYSNPFLNDMGGTMDCLYIGSRLEECIKRLEYYHNNVKKSI